MGSYFEKGKTDIARPLMPCADDDLAARLAAMTAERDRLREACETVLSAYDEHERPNKPVGSILARAIEAMRDALAPSADAGETTPAEPGEGGRENARRTPGPATRAMLDLIHAFSSTPGGEMVIGLANEFMKRVLAEWDWPRKEGDHA